MISGPPGAESSGKGVTFEEQDHVDEPGVWQGPPPPSSVNTSGPLISSPGGFYVCQQPLKENLFPSWAWTELFLCDAINNFLLRRNRILDEMYKQAHF